ncbi:MAG: hypothetical protein [Wendovervirus sonii]|uniref:Tail fiber protein n=1 Tax=phage Lak_Megaphage_Sonny TaxID=3109229 RepID=A0ABZ0Z626_9CAUD|nr:MAG: hypothetical protein [phage Lak_Megaphage_Sonny]
MGNINSFAENMRKTITAQTNALNLLESLQKSITTKDTMVTYDYENLSDAEQQTYQLPSYTAITNRLKALERTINNLSNGKTTVTLDDGSRRKIRLTNLAQTPSKITGVMNPSVFNIDSNWFFENLMFPGLTVSIDLTSKIEDSADRVKLSRIILNSTDSNTQNFWNNTLANNNYDYISLKSLLTYNSIMYSEDIETVELPLISNQVTGAFQIMEDPEIIDGNVWYRFDTLSYSTIDENGTTVSNNTLSKGDQLVYSNTLFTVVDVNQNTNQVHLKILNGSAFPGVFSIFTVYQDPFRSKEINVRFGIHEYNIIYIKGVNEDYNLLSNEWSEPIKFSSDELLFADDINMSALQYYHINVVDWGRDWIAQAKERRIMAYNGHKPNAPILNSADLRVVQINTQINAALDTAEIKNTAADIESVKSQLLSLKQTIAAQKDELTSITVTADYNAKQQEIATNTVDLKNLQTTYTTLVDTFRTQVAENSAVTEKPKYHIRGFFPIPLCQYRDDEKTAPEEIIGFDIAYRYICNDNTGTQLNTFTYTDTDGNSVVTGTFTDWIMEQSKLKQRIYNSETNMYEWKTENVADSTEININQLDIPISKGEKVEIKVRSISEAGYPDNPLKSDWSNTIVLDFPNNLVTTNAIADLIKEINDDALNIAITNQFDTVGVTTHLSDSVPNTNSVNGIYYKHTAENIAYEDMVTNGTNIQTINLQDKVNDIDARLYLIEQFLNNQALLLP